MLVILCKTPSITHSSQAQGSIVFLTSVLLFSAAHGWVLRGSAQFPLYQSGQNGEQEEKTGMNLGVSYLLSWSGR